MSDLNITVACPSDLQLDRLLAGDLREGERSELNAHLAGCAACRTRRDDFDARRAAYLQATPNFGALAARVGAAGGRRRPERGSPRGRSALWALAAAAVALLALRAALGGDQPPPHSATPADRAPQETRVKGGPDLGYFVKRGERVVAGEPGRALRPGDRVRFTVTSERAQQFALFNRDGRGATVYYPSGQRSAAIAAGKAVPLDFSVELDDYVGVERVLGVFCERPFELEPVRRSFDGPAQPSAPAGCTLRSVELRKEPAP
jgi:hypothetical protein